MNKTIFLVVLVPLLVLSLSLAAISPHVYASVTPEVHKCIHDQIDKMLAGITVFLALDHSPEGIASIGNDVNNDTAFIEKCLQ